MGKAVPQPKVLGKQVQIDGWNDWDTVDGSEIRTGGAKTQTVKNGISTTFPSTGACPAGFLNHQRYHEV